MHRKPTGPAPITTTGRPAEPVGLPDVSGACSGVALPGVDVSSAGLLGWQTQPLDPAGPVPQHWAFAAAPQQLTCSAGAQHPLTVPRSGPGLAEFSLNLSIHRLRYACFCMRLSGTVVGVLRRPQFSTLTGRCGHTVHGCRKPDPLLRHVPTSPQVRLIRNEWE